MTFSFFYIQWGQTPLLLAIESGHSDVAQLLINKRASIDVTNEVSKPNQSHKETFYSVPVQLKDLLLFLIKLIDMLIFYI